MASEAKSTKWAKTLGEPHSARVRRLRLLGIRAAAFALALVSAGTISSAADLTLRPAHPKKPQVGSISIVVRGPIEAGDADRLTELVRQVRVSGRPLLGVYLDSPGGNLREAVRMSDIIRAEGMASIMERNTRCASACVLLFAGGTFRRVYGGAMIGVHSASVDGRETADATLGTIVMARQASRLGIPDQIIGRMITAGPGAISWLTREEVVAIAGPYGVAADY